MKKTKKVSFAEKVRKEIIDAIESQQQLNSFLIRENERLEKNLNEQSKIVYIVLCTLVAGGLYSGYCIYKMIKNKMVLA